MPYITLERRAALDTIIDGLLNRLWEIECKKGDVNYCITRIILDALKPPTGWDYHSLSDCVSVARDSADEIQRRLLGPYEDSAASKNGDLPCLTPRFESKRTCKCKHKEELDKYQGNHPRTLKDATGRVTEALWRDIQKSRGTDESV